MFQGETKYPFKHLGGEEQARDYLFAQKSPVPRAGFEPGTFRSLEQHPTTRPPSPQTTVPNVSRIHTFDPFLNSPFIDQYEDLRERK
ncbi:hypothetical protein DPMN_069478 [Dreissena polymorpha]|uniref:Uncharacterized protein n=1 Tax=Dreissena polymorpha TaxID=45954 RepID=A0A9D4BUZ9_DREPO|nr:hypothetical protein DPMN_069478 [Dreissena polymorpha]